MNITDEEVTVSADTILKFRHYYVDQLLSEESNAAFNINYEIYKKWCLNYNFRYFLNDDSFTSLFLKQNDLNFNKSFLQAKKSLEVRTKFNIQDKSEQFFDFNLHNSGYIYYHGRTKYKTEILYINMKKVSKFKNLDVLKQYLLWHLERKAKFEHGTKLTVLINCENVSLYEVRKELILGIMHCFINYIPYRIKSLLAYKFSTILSGIWFCVKKFLSEQQTKRVFFVNEDTLKDHISDEELQIQFGGLNEYVYEYKENMFDHPPLNSENFTNFEGYSDYTFPGEPKQKPLESSTIDFSESMKVQTSQNKSINLEKLSIICSRENISENSYQGENKRKNDVKCTENEIQRERNKEGQCSDSLISKLDKNKKNLKNKEIKENNTCANCYSTPKKHKSFLSFYKFGKSPKKQKIVKNDNKEKIEKDANEKNNFRNSFKRFKNKKLNMDKSINSRVEIQDNNSSWEFVEVRPNRQSQKQSNYSEKMWDLSTNSSITPYDCKSQTVHDKILKRFRNSVLYRKVPKIHDKNIVTYINPEGSDIKINCDSLQSIIVKILSMKNGSKSIYDYGYRVKDNLTDCVLRPNKIMFKCDIDCQLYTVIRLKNIGAEYKIFRVECSESNYFTIQPNFGILSHGEEMTVSLFANEDKIIEKLKEIVIQTKIADRIDYPPIYPDDIVTLTVSTSNMLSSIQDKVECKRLHFSLKMLNSVYTGRTRAAFCGSNNQMLTENTPILRIVKVGRFAIIAFVCVIVSLLIIYNQDN